MLFRRTNMEVELEEEDDWTMVLTIARTQLSLTAAAIQLLVADNEEKIDHRLLPRKKRAKFNHDEALYCIKRDYLGPVPLFKDKQFDIFFRISRSRFQRLMEDVGASGHPFYMPSVNPNGRAVASLEARLLLPLKTLAYGVAPHCFSDYFYENV